MNIVLASASPRRYELLCGLGHTVRTVHPNVCELDESSQKIPQDIAKINAELKAEKVYNEVRLKSDEIIIAADTVVWLDKELFGKPKNLEHAGQILQRLSGNTHVVSTGYCVINNKGEKFSGVHCSDVRFRTLNQDEITGYLATKESLDKAGAYAVNGYGAALVASISGSISNIIGLPVEEVLFHARQLLEQA